MCCDRSTKLDYAGDDIAIVEAEVAPGSAVAYSTDDIIGGVMVFPNIAACPGGTGKFLWSWVYEKAGSGAPKKPDVRLYLFNRTFTPPADNTAWSFAAATPALDLDDFVAASFRIPNSWEDLDASYAKSDQGDLGFHPYKAADGDTTLYGILVLTSATTVQFTAGSALRVRLSLVRD